MKAKLYTDKQRPVSKRGQLTMRDAGRAVKAYLRAKPYTSIGIRRVSCLRCGEPSTQQWNICSLPGYHGICTDCDVALNALVLDFIGVPTADEVLARYSKRMAA